MHKSTNKASVRGLRINALAYYSHSLRMSHWRGKQTRPLHLILLLFISKMGITKPLVTIDLWVN